MAPRALQSALGLAMAVMAALCSRASAQSGCTAMVMNLSPCITYITGNMSAPPATCCTQLDNIVQTQMACLCMFLANGSPFQIPVNQTQVLSLPGSCNIKAGPLSQCNGELDH
ncbi:hypothetical protein Taro_014267 [Colocasia esculenta]|uniref:Bifunctional inhibitor/plant lipid transfer protein/seed storage helical domain-containing protein n=1 Tax=Colocasia esculenta TaxID=4460 RepID=A0A843ULA2_COLES|nr:hypothetical protein [Colocasia esculenta]